MPKLTIIGAGSVSFTRQILSAALSYPALQDMHIALQDINSKTLDTTRRVIELMIAQSGLPATVSVHTNQYQALVGADFVICTVQVGGLEAWRIDRDVPKKYGVDQEVGDTLGPGGIFRGLRHIPVLVSILRDMEEVCPNALLMNYVNPLAPLVWAADRVSKVTCIGLCYGVAYTVTQLAGYLGVGPWIEHPYTNELWDALLYASVPEDLEFSFGGINHLCWILNFKYRGKDLYPEIRSLPSVPTVYESDGVRCEMLKAFGWWCTENHWHMTDYVPYFRKNSETIDRFLPRRWNLMDLVNERALLTEQKTCEILEGKLPLPLRRNMLNAPRIMNAVTSGEPVRISGNLPNRGLIDNLPADCTVEVPITVDDNGLHPQAVGVLPAQCAALCRTNINVQELLVNGALSGDREAVKHACMLDPVTSAVCTLDQISAMTEELFEAQLHWLPDFK